MSLLKWANSYLTTPPPNTSRGYSVAKSDLQPGDGLFGLNGSASIQHVGIYVGNNKVYSCFQWQR